MEQRREPRFAVHQRVLVTLLDNSQVKRLARIQNVSGRGVGLLMPDAVSPGAAVQIDLENEIVLGEVIYCRPEPEGYFLGVELDQVLSGLAELAARLEEFSAPPIATPPGSR